MKISLVSLIASLILIASCQFLNTGGEQEMLDTPPPQGYNQNFLSGTSQINSGTSSPKIDISQIDVSNPDKVKVYFHLIDKNNTFVKGGAEGDWKNIWCEVIDSSESETPIKNFTIRESVEADLKPIAMSIVTDHSGSMGIDRAKTVQNAINKLIETKKPNDKVGYVRYDSKVVNTLDLTIDKAALKNGNPVNGLEGFGGMTATIDGIDAGIDMVANESKEYRKIVVVFTDGSDNSSKKLLKETVDKAIRNGVTICAFDYGYYTTPGLLKTAALETGGIYNQIYSTKEFDYVFDDIYFRLNNYYMLEYDPGDYGNHKLKFKICLDSNIIEANQEFNNIPKPGSINLVDVYFDTGKWAMKKESDPNLKKLLLLMKRLKDIKIELQGHTDNVGKPEENLTLSQKRADAVKDYLIKNGIDAIRITTKGFGDTMPIEDNSTPEGRAKNRRTQFIVKN